jgi:hypothetical protein
VVGGEFEKFYKHGIIVQLDGDSGDSCQRTGTFLFLNWVLGNTSPTIAADMFFKLQSSRGRFRRSSDPNHWGYRPSNLSRDQLSVMRLALSVYKSRIFNVTYALQAKRLGLHQNFLRGTDDPDECWKMPDIMSPEEIALWIRHNNLWILWPLVFCIDLLSLLFLVYRKNDNWDQDNMNAARMYYSVLIMPTPVAKLAMALYTKTNYLERIDNYYSEKNNGIPPMAKLYRLADAKVRKQLWENTFWLRWFF